MVTCPNCGSSVPAATFCQVCGHTLASAGVPASTGPLPGDSGGGGGSPTVAVSPGQTDPLSGPPAFSPPPPPPSYNAQPYSQPGYTPPPSYSPGAYQPPTQQMGQGQPGYASQPPTQYMPPPPYQTQQLGQGQPPAYPPPYAPYPVVPPANYAPGYPYQQAKDPTIAFVLELIGLFGILGIGHMYGGRIGRGVGIMFGFWAYLAVSVILTFVVVGCVLLLFSLVIPVLSGLWIKSDLEKERAAMWRP